ncbi:DUF4124 domain-containing protein [Endozoicomonas sp.]|uniref:DUF4124 domain-containing protein n=1 Tax=Endozoicomonas sp. TaxID=1892382 RepID=UPI00383AF3EB
MKQLLFAQVFLFALLLPIAGAAEPIYKWKDDHGIVHFSTTPPKNQTNTEVMAKPEVQKISGDASQMTEDEEYREETVKEQTPEPATAELIIEPQQKTAEELAYCNSLKGNIAKLKSSPRIRVKSKDGEYEILDNAARQKEIDRISTLLDSFCANSGSSNEYQ